MKEEHEEDECIVALRQCEHCKKEFPLSDIAEHQTMCSFRFSNLKRCQYCDGQFSAAVIFDHVFECGSRTRKCEICQKNVIMRGNPIRLL
jgi:hypothetical protein